MRFRPQILIVEDDPASQDMLMRRLASRGFRVASAADGESCLAFVKNTMPDLILLDINLPGLNGLEVLKELRQGIARDALPIIMVTALADSDDVIRGLQAGANDYIAKPINFSVLMARMQVCLQIKYDVAFLVEAERQRVLILAIGEACHQLAQPMQAATMTLESLIHHPAADPQATVERLKEVLEFTNEVGEVIHRMQNVATMREMPYTERIEFLEKA